MSVLSIVVLLVVGLITADSGVLGAAKLACPGIQTEGVRNESLSSDGDTTFPPSSSKIELAPLPEGNGEVVSGVQ